MCSDANVENKIAARDKLPSMLFLEQLSAQRSDINCLSDGEFQKLKWSNIPLSISNGKFETVKVDMCPKSQQCV